MGLIRKELKQKHPDLNKTTKALVNVMFTGAWVANSLKVLLRPYGITLKQNNILIILDHEEFPMTTSEIRDQMIDNVSDVTRLIDRLVTKGYVRRKKQAKDKRLVDISITQLGIELLDRISIHTTLENLANTLDESDVEQLNLLLGKLRNI